MREHQININLKAQQFELLQKLAREKGYKSVSAYVREKIMELAFALEPQENSGSAASQSARIDAESIKELSRIHNEMQQFIKESLGLGFDAQMPHATEQAQDHAAVLQTADTGTVAPEKRDSFDLAFGVPAGQPISVVPPFDVNSLADDLSNLAQPQSLLSPDNFYTESPQVNQSSTSQSGHAANQSAVDAFFNTGGASTSRDSSFTVSESNQAIFSSQNNLGGFAYSLGNYSGFGGNTFAPRFGGAADAGSDRLNGYKEILDDLEELADRAFAISPRLGSLTEEAEEDMVTESSTETGAAGGGARTVHRAGSQPQQAAMPAQATPAIPAPMQTAPPVVSPSSDSQPVVSPDPLPPPAPTPAPAQAALQTPAQAQAAAPMPEPISAPVSGPVSAIIDSQSKLMGSGVAAHQPVQFDPLAAIEDDLLDDLLDGDLLAQAHAPRDNNPFAVDLPFNKLDEEIAQVGPLDVLEPEPAASDAVSNQHEQFDSIQGDPSDSSVPAIEPADKQLVAPLGNTNSPAEITTVVDQSVQPSVSSPVPGFAAEPSSGIPQTSAGALSDPVNPPAQPENQEERSRDSQEESQDANSMGLSGLSGGPPPKRRRT